MVCKVINFAEKLASFSDRWAPRVVASLNEIHFKLVKLEGEFIWHRHPETEEAFIVLEGAMTIEFREGQVDLEAGEMAVVPRNVEHRPRARRECRVLLVEPAGTPSTGDSRDGPGPAAERWI